MEDDATPEKVSPLDLAEIEERVAAKMRELRKAHPGANLRERLRKAFPE